MKKLLVVDDDLSILKVLKMRLESEGYAVDTATRIQEALKLAKETEFDLGIVDLKLSGESGIDLMKALHDMDPELPVIILTAHGTIESAVEAMKLGAYIYLTKPFDYRELLLQIKNGMEKAELSKEVKRLRRLVKHDFEGENIIGESGPIKKVLELVSLAAQTDANVYIYGESGSGKGVIAKALHRLSERRDKPFVAINCAAIPETLLESELFGFEKGAFTGAGASKKGLFVQADGGIVFLDEISEIPLSMQGKLLKALEDKEFYPLGSQKPVKVDVRIISASNRVLQAEVEKGTFRSDLFYRVHVIPITIPPLRERIEDIPLLVNYFLHKFAKKMKKEIKTLTPSALQKLMIYTWPGNVRELENVIECAVVMGLNDLITEELLLLPSGKSEDTALKPLKESKHDFERNYLIQLLEISRGNISQAAKLAGK
ncbi:MAG: sigma-54 dependent transcriptional regulator, partial [Syntrophales bacterium]|nr:sigma-54 dependent transcriptional regulator [Syntrophales bacterium]